MHEHWRSSPRHSLRSEDCFANVHSWVSINLNTFQDQSGVSIAGDAEEKKQENRLRMADAWRGMIAISYSMNFVEQASDNRFDQDWSLFVNIDLSSKFENYSNEETNGGSPSKVRKTKYQFNISW